MTQTLLTPLENALARVSDLYCKTVEDIYGMVQFDLGSTGGPLDWFRATTRLLHKAHLASSGSAVGVFLSDGSVKEKKIIPQHYDKLIFHIPAGEEAALEEWKREIIWHAERSLNDIRHGWGLKSENGKLWYSYEIPGSDGNDIQPLIFMSNTAHKFYHDRLRYSPRVSDSDRQILTVSQNAIDTFLKPAGLSSDNLFDFDFLPQSLARPAPRVRNFGL